MASSALPASSPSLFYFLFLTIAYSILKYFANGKTSLEYMWLGIYFLLILIGQFFLNLNMASALCGEPQYATATLVTFVPWVLIFGVLEVLLLVFPGWLSPFANTFGYLVTRLAGVNKTLDGLLNTTQKGVPAITKAVQDIYNDPSLFINEITPRNFTDVYDRMTSGGVFNKDGVASGLKEKLEKLVRLKDIVAEFIWFVLAGFLVTSVSFNYTVSAGCDISTEEIKKREQAALEKAKKEAEDSAPKKKRVYSTFE